MPSITGLETFHNVHKAIAPSVLQHPTPVSVMNFLDHGQQDDRRQGHVLVARRRSAGHGKHFRPLEHVGSVSVKRSYVARCVVVVWCLGAATTCSQFTGSRTWPVLLTSNALTRPSSVINVHGIVRKQWHRD